MEIYETLLLIYTELLLKVEDDLNINDSKAFFRYIKATKL